MESIIKRNMLLLVIGKFTSILGAGVYTFAASFYVLQVTGSGMNFAITLLCGSLPRIVLGPFAGVIADRFSRRLLVIGMDVMCGAIMLTSFIISLTFGPNLLLIYITSALLSICSTFFSVAFSSSIPGLVDDTRIQRITSLNQAAGASANILSPIIGGIIYGFLSLSSFMFANGITFLLSALLEVFIVFNLFITTKQQATKKEPLLASLKEGYTYMKNHKGLFSLLKIAFWINFFFSAIMVCLPYFIIKELSLTSQQFGIIEAMFAVGTLSVAIFLSMRTEIQNKYAVMRYGLLFLACLLTITVLPLLLPPIPSLLILIFYMLITFSIGGTTSFINTPLLVLLQRSTPEEYLGRVFGFLDTIAGAIMPLGFILFGFLLDIVPSYYIPIGCGIALGIIVLRYVTKPIFTLLEQPSSTHISEQVTS
ncbi:MFS transporter [Priestia taiwanensis]|uniref:MFS transporter n=1 Tax=Priestia taiwanensis TaxID=1347902 RepID=A0A917EQA6_9BACI|nr:MFS transporter [Priestia taiwanensis]MBM7363716.1 MFS family permease [Priestia taiwanensis]GGE74720.1 MFS transporter [Priestia taiwanensis]